MEFLALLDKGTESLVQTIAILAAALVYLTKESLKTYKRVRNGKADGACGYPCEECARKVAELHMWHQPTRDSKSGQPHFPWYSDVGLKNEVTELRKAMETMRVSIRELTQAMRDFSGARPGG